MSDVTMEDQLSHLAESEPIPGYRLIAPLGRGGFGEVWKCEAPGGLLKAIKFVSGSYALEQTGPADEELRAIQRVKTVRHPFILSMERVEVVSGELVIVSELADRSLADVLAARKAEGKPGIAREALLSYLREAAEALDVMHVRHSLQHLDVKPQNLFLVCDHVKVGDFGLVQSVSGGAGDNVSLGAITPLYAAPEVFQGRISTHADQYSLAIVYQELLTGVLPFNGRNSRQLMMQHVQGEPDLEALPEADRPLVARALAKNPTARFRSCSDLINALATGQADASATVVDLPLRAATPGEDTRRTPSVKTVKTRTISSRRPPIAPGDANGLEILDLVSRTPLSEVWNARTDDGEARLVKVLFANASAEAVARLAALRHPVLAPVEILQHAKGKLVLATPAGDRSLRDFCADHQALGQTGIPRGRMLAWLRKVAEMLDDLAEELALFHLSLQPRSLLLDGEHLRLTDFALAQLVWQPCGQALGTLNARYAAPELSAGQVGPACDQYSLALIYHELTTGAGPAAVPGRKNELSVERLPPSDRDAIGRALQADPKKRWPSAVELVLALEQAGGFEHVAETPAPARPTHRAPVVPSPVPVDGMQARLGTNLTEEAIGQRLTGFREQWNAILLSEQDQSYTYQVRSPSSFWQRWTGRQPALEIVLEIGTPEIDAPAGVQVRTEVLVTIRAKDCSREQSADLIKAVGSLLVDSVRQHLRAATRGREQERVLWPYALQVCSIMPGGGLGPPIECQGKDVSLNGIGFYLPGQLPSSHLQLRLPKTAQTPHMVVPARVVRVQGCGDGWYEVGAVLLPPDELPPDEELLDASPLTE